jgi:hypothetical protein
MFRFIKKAFLAFIAIICVVIVLMGGAGMMLWSVAIHLTIFIIPLIIIAMLVLLL